MIKYLVLTLCCALVGCQSAKEGAARRPYTITDELNITVHADDAEEEFTFSVRHKTFMQEKGRHDSYGQKSEFSIQLKPSVWARVKRSSKVIGYTSQTECLLDGEMVEVSGMPGENFTVKIEPLALNRYRVLGIFLASQVSESGELGKTIPFDYVTEAGTETTVYRKTVAFDSGARR
ncbi:hypothetical protein P4E94_11560 [Pontiellaceae bacterium B12219]|nr:hypothetical protein [Pontiellaceae bacterium B12219]